MICMIDVVEKMKARNQTQHKVPFSAAFIEFSATAVSKKLFKFFMSLTSKLIGMKSVHAFHQCVTYRRNTLIVPVHAQHESI